MNISSCMKNNSLIKRFNQCAGLLGIVTVLSGCVWLAAGTIVVTAVDLAYDRRTAGVYVDDNVVELKIQHEISLDPKLKGSVNISVTSVNGIVLLTGETPTEEQKQLVEKVARSQSEVRQVVNELEIGGRTGLGSRRHDVWLNVKVKTRLMRTEEIKATHVNVVIERSNVYLMGLVTEAEAEAAVNAARSVKGVVRIIKVFEYIS